MALARDSHLAVVPLMDEGVPGYTFSHDLERSDSGIVTGQLFQSASRFVTLVSFDGISGTEDPTELSDLRRILNYYYSGGQVRVYRKYPTNLSPWDISSNPEGYSDLVPDDVTGHSYPWFASMRSFSFDLRGMVL